MVKLLRGADLPRSCFEGIVLFDSHVVVVIGIFVSFSSEMLMLMLMFDEKAS